jgi:hypothetical protein
LDVWRDSANASRVALPRLKDLSWDIHVIKKASSGSSSSTSVNVPVVRVNLTVEEQTLAGIGPQGTEVNFELSREALATMLDGFGRIKDQLAGSV